MDKTPLDDQWQELTKDWQAQPYPKVDIDKLIKQGRRNSFYAFAILLADVIATILLLVSFLYGYFASEWPNALIGYLGFGTVFSAIFVYYEYKIRYATWYVKTSAPDKLIQNTLKGYQASIQYALLIKWSCLPLFIGMNWFVFAVASQKQGALLTALAIPNVLLVIVFVLTHLFQRKRQQQHHELEQKMQDNS